MTMRELFAWAEENNAMDMDIEIKYRDSGGCYDGVDECDPFVTKSENDPSKMCVHL